MNDVYRAIAACGKMSLNGGLEHQYIIYFPEIIKTIAL